MHNYLKIDTGLFIPNKVLKKIGIDSEKIEVEFTENEIRIHPVKKKICSLIPSSPLMKYIGCAAVIGVNGKNHDKFIYDET